MKKIIINFFLLIIILSVSLISILSTFGIETNKFNNIISSNAAKTKNINLDLDTIKFKIDLKELSLFLETKNPKVTYREIFVPIKNIKVYIDFLPLLKSKTTIKKISIILEELDISQLSKLSLIIKPSNLKSILNNKIKEGKLISEIDLFLNEQGSLKDFIARGSVDNLNIELVNDLNFNNGNLSFFADKNDILIKNIFGELENIQISDGDIKLNLENGIKLNSNFKSKVKFDKKISNKYVKFFNKFSQVNKISDLSADLNNSLSIDMDKTYKVKNYTYQILGNLEKSKFEFSKPIKNYFVSKELKEIYFSDLQIEMKLDPINIYFKGEGKYSLNNNDFLQINLENFFKNNSNKLKLNFDYKNDFELSLINYKKDKNSIANLSLELEKKKDDLLINKLAFIENKNSIKINDLKFKKEKFLSFKKIEVVTKNNNFFVKKGKQILIKGTKFDATNLTKLLGKQSNNDILQKISSNIEIDFKDIEVPMSETLENFKLIGEIEKGQFVKISSKGDFGGGNFLDISMKKDKNSKKKFLEIYSDLTRPLLTEYNFFKGLSGGKLLFSSIIDDTTSLSKLKIENFKVVNAPGVIKLLSLADLSGLADLAEGDGLTFDVLEIDMEKSEKFLKLNEILALGPSISVLMEGYQDENGLTSLRGTLVPAKTLNKMISKIPVIGNIVIPKEIGEGLFGISFKMKGTEGKIKTTINPIRTLTPRFIQKIIDRNKETK